MKKLWIKIVKEMIAENIEDKQKGLPPRWRQYDFENIGHLRISLY